MNKTSQRRTQSAAQAIEQHVNRYALTVTEAIARLPVFEGSTVTAEEALCSLVAQKKLYGTLLYRGRRCYFRTIGRRPPGDVPSTRWIDEPERLSEESKIRHFAMLSFCCLAATPRIRMTGPELARLLPQGDTVHSAGSYYFRPGPPAGFGFLRVDMGGDGRWDRILAKCCDDARTHAYSPKWQGLIEAGQFEITLATSLPQKVERLVRALQGLSSPPGVPIRIAAIPELMNLISPPPE